MSEYSSCTPAVPDYSNPVRGTAGSPAGLDDSYQGLRSREFDQLSRGLRTGSKCPQGQSAVLGDSVLFPKSCRVNLLSRAYWAVVQGPRGRSDVRGDLTPYPRSRGVDQLSWMIRAWVRLPAMSTSCPIQFVTGSADPRV